MKPDQQRIDFDNPSGQRRSSELRYRHRRAIEQLQLPTPPEGWKGGRRRPAPRTCKAVLLALDGHQRLAEGWAIKAATLAAELGYTSRDTVQRALHWLQDLGLVSITRRGRSSLLCLDRAAIAQLLADQQAPEVAAPQPSDACSAANRCLQRSQQMAAAQPSDLLTPTQALNPQSTEEEGADGNSTDGWTGLRRDLLDATVAGSTVQRLVLQLQQAGASLDEVRAVLQHWRDVGRGGSPHAAWGPGALVERLRSCGRGQQPEEGWPTPSEQWEAAERRNHAAAERQATANRLSEHRRQVEAERHRTAALEATLGPTLDELPEQNPGAWSDLVSRLPPLLQSRTDGGLARALLLEMLDGRDDLQPVPASNGAAHAH